jgi:hypothetical protein
VRLTVIVTLSQLKTLLQVDDNELGYVPYFVYVTARTAFFILDARIFKSKSDSDLQHLKAVAALEGPEFEANRNSLGSFGSANALLSTVAPEQEDARVAAAGSSLMSDPLARPREASKDLGEPTSLATGYSNDGNGALGESEDLFVNTSSSIRRGSGPTISVGVAPQFSTGSLDEALGPPVKEPRSAPPLKMKRARTLSNAHSHVPLTTGGTTGDGTAPPAPKMVARSVGAGLWPYVRQQIFLGIAASSVPVKHDVSDLREDLTNAGVRFIYFSPRNMRRSKPVAEKIGIEFDWNCAISLRDLDGGDLDPHRAISSYGDWDFHAKMPHGVEAIKRHLVEVDNVPLLVSLYTDATPRTIDQMVHVFQDYGEVVMSVGSAYRDSNQQIFNSSDVAVSVGVVPGDTRPIPISLICALDKFPDTSHASLTKSDMLLHFRLVGLSTVSLLQLSVSPEQSLIDARRGSAVGTDSGGRNSGSSANGIGNPASDAFVLNMLPLQEHHHSPELRLSALLTGIRAGRVFLLHAVQCLMIGCVFCLSMGVWCVLATCVPISIPPYLSPNTVLLFSFLYLPLILCAVLVSRGPSTVMKSTPRKNTFVRRDEKRLVLYTAARVAYVVCTTYLFAYVVSICIFTPSDNHWYQWDNHFTTFRSRSKFSTQEPCLPDFWLFQDMVAAELLLNLLFMSVTMVERGQDLSHFPTPFSHKALYAVLFVICAVHVTFIVVRAQLRRVDHAEEICYLARAGTRLIVDAKLGLHAFPQLNWVVWFLLGLFPFAGIIVGTVVNRLDMKWNDRYLKFLRLEFDTRLGMHSPR